MGLWSSSYKSLVMMTGSAIATLVVFFLSNAFVIFPVSIRLRPFFPHIRIQINFASAPVLGVAILWATECIGTSVIRDGIVGVEGIKPYNIVILFISLTYMSISLQITGVLDAAALWLRNKVSSNGYKAYFYAYVLFTLLSMVLGNYPVILLGTPSIVLVTSFSEVNPISWLFAKFAAANTASMVLFVGNPTNVVLCEGFRINNATYSAYTIFPFIACSVVCFVSLAFQFRDMKYIQRRLPLGHFYSRAVLLDPVGAWVGGVLLGTCLVAILAVSHFGIDVWKITLPFTVVKLIWDFAWDLWRGLRGMHVHMALKIEKSMRQDSFGISTEPSRRDMLSGDARQIPGEVNLPESFPVKTTLLSQKLPQQEQFIPTIFYAFRRLPFALVPFVFSQFILIEGLRHQGWVDVFAVWLVRATGRAIYPTIWIVGIFGVIMCNFSGSNIGATILLTKVLCSPQGFSRHSSQSVAAAIALAVASNIGAVNLTPSASPAGLLWRRILNQKGISVRQQVFAFWNLLPIIVMTVTGLAVVCVEMAVLY
jgi:Na+/H+ antiporter NhaD/arsenite permease-like protein